MLIFRKDGRLTILALVVICLCAFPVFLYLSIEAWFKNTFRTIF